MQLNRICFRNMLRRKRKMHRERIYTNIGKV